MKQIILLFACLLFGCMTSYSETNQDTKNKVDILKMSISYTKLNIGETLYDAFIKDDKIGSNIAKLNNLGVKKVKITDIKAYNDIAAYDWFYGRCLNSINESNTCINRTYQFIDTAVANPKVRDLFDCSSEHSFGYTYDETLNRLVQILKMTDI